MLVKGAGTLIGHQPKKQERAQASKKDDSFQSVLSNTQKNAKKRKPLKSLAKKPMPKPKQQNNDVHEQDAKPMKPMAKPKKQPRKEIGINAQKKPNKGPQTLKNQNENQPQKTLGKNQKAGKQILQPLKPKQPLETGLKMTQANVEGQSVQQVKVNQLNQNTEQKLTANAIAAGAGNGLMTEAEVSKVVESNPLLKDFSLMQKAQENGTGPVSINSSEAKIKALEKNIEKLEKFEKTFSDYVSQEVNKKKQATENLGAKTLQNNGSKSMLQDMKLEAMTKKTTFGEDAELAANSQEAGLSGLKLKDFSSDNGASSEQGLDMNSMFAQGLEQDTNNVDTPSSFVEAMNEVDMQGQKSEKIENMQSIIKQARAFVKDGGGTMQIELSPEGMGKVHLKVAVQEGSVNVEMMADNKMAKQALEDGLFEIKNALEGQKLLVETLKVEMSPDYQKDFSDMKDHMQEQANRDFAEDFLGQFRQDRQMKYGGMFDGFRNFTPGQREPELTLNQSRNPYTGNGKGSTLNVVA
ncbi:MAG: flagellar hook-length control protein FliK [Bdellovibrionales bacterium]|nr:flagellar hook-length control protein FliK [Bdellovibrionales bacterium]